MKTLTISRNGQDYEAELEGICYQHPEPENGISAEYMDVIAWNDELGHVILTVSEEIQALHIVNDDLWENGRTNGQNL